MVGGLLAGVEPEFGVFAGDEAVGGNGFQTDLDGDSSLALGRRLASIGTGDGKMFYRDLALRPGCGLILSGFLLHNPVSTTNDQSLICRDGLLCLRIPKNCPVGGKWRPPGEDGLQCA